jgi:hypothetical protein
LALLKYCGTDERELGENERKKQLDEMRKSVLKLVGGGKV